MTAPHSLKLRRGLWSPLSHASQLSQTLIGCILHGIDKVSFGEQCQHNFTTWASVFRAPQCRDHRCSQRTYQPESEATRRETIHGRRSNQTRNQAGFRLKRQRCPTNAPGDCDAFPDPFLRIIIGHSSCTPELNPKWFGLADNIKMPPIQVDVSSRLQRSFSGGPTLVFPRSVFAV